MPKTLHVDTAAAIAQPTVRPAWLVLLDFESGAVRAASTPFSLWWDHDADAVDEEFLGVGTFGSISGVEETIEGKANRVTLGLTLNDPALLSAALNESYQKRRAWIWKAYLDADWQIAGQPVLRWRGLMEPMSWDFGPPARLALPVVGRTVRWERPLDAPLWDDRDHQRRRPGDTFFSRMAEITAGKEVSWGR